MLRVESRSPTRLIAGGLIAVALVTALVISLIGGDADEQILSEAPTATSPTSSSSTVAVTPAPLETSSAPVSRFSSDHVQLAGEAVLGAWGRFVGSGDLMDLDGHFHPLSPQRPLLEENVVKIPPEGPPHTFVMSDPRIEPLAEGFAAMQGLVTTTRADRVLEESEWRLVLAWSKEAGSWLVWTLEDLG